MAHLVVVLLVVKLVVVVIELGEALQLVEHRLDRRELLLLLLARRRACHTRPAVRSRDALRRRCAPVLMRSSPDALQP
eukprot:5011723-Prymnesium_polylepis.2